MRDLKNERGAVLVLVAAFMTVFFGVAALVVDHGHNLSEYRRLTTATDAAALAAAGAYGAMDTGCDDVAIDYLTRNAAGSNLTSCVVVGDTVTGTFGWVVVTADLPVDQYFAPVLGRDVVTVSSESVAMFGMPTTSFSDVRPMGLCLAGLEADTDYLAWQSSAQDQPSAPIRVIYDKTQPDSCGSTTGNWGFVDFDAGSNSNNDTIDWIRDGYPGPVAPGLYEGDPGAISGSHRSALDSLVDGDVVFWLPVFDQSSGNGANVSYFVTHFLPVQLVDFKSTGKQSKRYLEFVITPEVLSSASGCCAPAGSPDNGLRKTVLISLDENGQPRGLAS